MPRRPATLAFLALVFGVPLGQAGWELSRGERVQALDVLREAPQPAHLRAYEDALRRASFVREKLVPAYDRALLLLFGRGNEKVLRGRDGWLFYSEDLDLLTARDHVAGEAAAAVVDLRDQLARRDVQLLVLPVEPKTVVEHARLGIAQRPEPEAERVFRAALSRAQVPVVELPPDLEYLPRDTHWTPASMRAVAERTAARALELLGAPPEPRVAWIEEQALVRGDGDLVGMLTAPGDPPRMELVVDRVLDDETRGYMHADRAAEVLLLGDSFTRVFSDPALGLGRGAGFDAHLARCLGSSLDVIAIPGGAARAVREALARRTGGVAGGVAGKRLVVWQLSLRDLVADAARWEPLDLSAATGEALPAGEQVVEAELVERTAAPPDFDYATLLAVHEYRVLRTLQGELQEGAPIWVAHLVLRGHEPTPESRLAVGARRRLTLVPVEDRYDLESTSWVDETGAGPRILFADEAEPVD